MALSSKHKIIRDQREGGEFVDAQRTPSFNPKRIVRWIAVPGASADIRPAVTSSEEIAQMKPEQVRWGHHWHHRHWGWHHRHWGWRHRHWGWHHRWHHRRWRHW